MRLARLALVTGLGIGMLFGAGSAAGYSEQLFPIFPIDRRGCQIFTYPLVFGNYDPIDGRLVDALGQVRYICDRVENPNRALRDVQIKMSRGAMQSFSDRGMLGPSYEVLKYNVYLDATHTTIWGDGSGDTDYYTDRRPPNGNAVVVPIYGRIRPLQDVPAGAYADLLQVTILF